VIKEGKFLFIIIVRKLRKILKEIAAIDIEIIDNGGQPKRNNFETPSKNQEARSST